MKKGGHTPTPETGNHQQIHLPRGGDRIWTDMESLLTLALPLSYTAAMLYNFMITEAI